MKPLPIAFSLIGHKERSFDVRFSSDGKQLLSGSQDGTARLWDVASRKCTATLKHNSESEVLRCAFLGDSSSSTRAGENGSFVNIIATGGADGLLKIWAPELSSVDVCAGSPSRFHVVCDLDHSGEQIYACESFHTGSSRLRLLSAAGSLLYVWDLGSGRALSERVSFQGGARSGADAFGGPRNPENQIFVFDAKPCVDEAASTYGCAAAALSDGTVRFRDFRSPSEAFSITMTSRSNLSPRPSANGEDGTSMYGVLSSLQRASGGCSDSAPPVLASEDANTHPTSVHWSTIDGSRSVAASLSSGDVAIIDVRMGVLRSRFLGCHRSTCFGVTSVSALGESSSSTGAGSCGGAYTSWSSDGTIRIWREDLTTLDLLSASIKHPYAVFSVATAPSRRVGATSGARSLLRLALAGGSGGAQPSSFLGEPIIVADVSQDSALPAPNQSQEKN